MSTSYKLLTVVTVFLFISCKSARSQSVNIPSQVSAAFQQKYPGYKADRWETKDDRFIAGFSQKRARSYAAFSKDGTWINTCTKVKFSKQLPDAFRNTFTKSPYASWYIVSIARYEQPGANAFYRITVNNSNTLDGDHADIFLKTHSLDVHSSEVILRD